MTAMLHLANGRRAIEHKGVRLACPRVPPGTPREIRVQILELVLRGLFGEAHDLAQDAIEEAARGFGPTGRLAAMMSETPHHTSRSVAA